MKNKIKKQSDNTKEIISHTTTSEGYEVPAFFDPMIKDVYLKIQASSKINTELEPYSNNSSFYGAFNTVISAERHYLNNKIKDGASPSNAYSTCFLNDNNYETFIASIAYRRESLCSIFINRVKFTIKNFIKDLYEKTGVAVYEYYTKYFTQNSTELTDPNIVASYLDDKLFSALNSNISYRFFDNRFNLINIILGIFKEDFIGDMTNTIMSEIFNEWYAKFFINIKIGESAFEDANIINVFVTARDDLYDLYAALFNEACTVYYAAGYFDLFPVIPDKKVMDSIAIDPFYYTAKSLKEKHDIRNCVYNEE